MEVINGIGFHSMWGFSPSKDLLNLCENSNSTTDEHPISILLLQPCDPRHIIHTIAHRHRSFETSENPRPIHFYVFERQPEVIARLILLLHIFLDELPIRQRASLFLEVYGNSLLQERTEVYVEKAGKLLQQLVIGNEYDGHLGKMVDFSFLKQKEVDALYEVFGFWKREKEFDAVTLRDQRLRAYYGDRFDCRENVIDGDYHSRVKKVASIIHIKQWREWRMSGIAFEFGDATYSSPNRSMCSFAEGRIQFGRDRGGSNKLQGFWLDILVGPYIAYGVQCDPVDKHTKDLFYIANKGTGAEQHHHHVVEVALYNVLAFMFEMETGKLYKMKKVGDIFSGLGEETTYVGTNSVMKDEKDGLYNDNYSTTKSTDLRSNSVEKLRDVKTDKVLDGVKIMPLSGDIKNLLTKKEI